MSLWHCPKHGTTNYNCCAKSCRIPDAGPVIYNMAAPARLNIPDSVEEIAARNGIDLSKVSDTITQGDIMRPSEEDDPDERMAQYCAGCAALSEVFRLREELYGPLLTAEEVADCQQQSDGDYCQACGTPWKEHRKRCDGSAKNCNKPAIGKIRSDDLRTLNQRKALEALYAETKATTVGEKIAAIRARLGQVQFTVEFTQQDEELTALEDGYLAVNYIDTPGKMIGGKELMMKLAPEMVSDPDDCCKRTCRVTPPHSCGNEKDCVECKRLQSEIDQLKKLCGISATLIRHMEMTAVHVKGSHAHVHALRDVISEKDIGEGIAYWREQGFDFR
jgi:hypothetical protein